MKDFQKTLLLENERNALQEASLFLKEQYPVEKLVLFGSKARGDSDEYSDIDILVISSRVLSWQEEKVIVENLFDIGMKYDVIFSPLLLLRRNGTARCSEYFLFIMRLCAKELLSHDN